jgi:hypothetical protein
MDTKGVPFGTFCKNEMVVGPAPAMDRIGYTNQWFVVARGGRGRCRTALCGLIFCLNAKTNRIEKG